MVTKVSFIWTNWKVTLIDDLYSCDPRYDCKLIFCSVFWTSPKETENYSTVYNYYDESKKSSSVKVRTLVPSQSQILLRGILLLFVLIKGSTLSWLSHIGLHLRQFYTTLTTTVFIYFWSFSKSTCLNVSNTFVSINFDTMKWDNK